MHADVARSEAHTRHDVEGGPEIGGQIEHRRPDATLGVGSAGHDAPRGQMLHRPE